METSVFDEQEVKSLLSDPGGGADRALTLIERHLRTRVCAGIRKSFPGMTPEDLAETWQDTLCDVLRVARQGRFDFDGGLLPWLHTIARGKAVDRTRRKVKGDEVLAAVGRALRDTQAGRRWMVLRASDKDEVMALIRDAIGTLPERQRQVFQIFVDHYPDSRSMKALQEGVSSATGRPTTLASVKRALQEGRDKVRELLRDKGYALGEKRGDT